MPITCRFDPDLGIAHEVATGTLTASELLEAHTRRQAGSVQKVLSDYLDATLDATAPELRMLAVAMHAVEAERGRMWGGRDPGPSVVWALPDAGGVPGTRAHGPERVYGTGGGP